jgi:hypothetical protein
MATQYQTRKVLAAIGYCFGLSFAQIWSNVEISSTRSTADFIEPPVAKSALSSLTLKDGVEIDRYPATMARLHARDQYGFGILQEGTLE